MRSRALTGIIIWIICGCWGGSRFSLCLSGRRSSLFSGRLGWLWFSRDLSQRSRSLRRSRLSRRCLSWRSTLRLCSPFRLSRRIFRNSRNLSASRIGSMKYGTYSSSELVESESDGSDGVGERRLLWRDDVDLRRRLRRWFSRSCSKIQEE